MDTKQKYVRLKQYNSIIIFPTIIDHADFKGFGVHSAGFCYVHKTHISCFGESIGLRLKSDVEDSFYATKQIIGLDEALELKSKEK